MATRTLCLFRIADGRNNIGNGEDFKIGQRDGSPPRFPSRNGCRQIEFINISRRVIQVAGGGKTRNESDIDRVQ